MTTERNEKSRARARQFALGVIPVLGLALALIARPVSAETPVHAAVAAPAFLIPKVVFCHTKSMPLRLAAMLVGTVIFVVVHVASYFVFCLGCN